jgi:methylmalonyl-CoA/ethylmalonyl-CoA epimerase
MDNHLSGLKYHHTGCLVKNLEESVENYKSLLPGIEVSPIYNIASQKVRLVFLKLNEGANLELIECLEGNTTLIKMLNKGTSFYHIAFTTGGRTLDTIVSELEESGYRLISKFTSAAFENKSCAFLFSPEMHMIELIEINN